MKLSRDEEIFLHHWIFEEMHYRAGPGRAKRMQLEHGVNSSDLAALIAASMPIPAAQEAAGIGPPPAEPPVWPWPADALAGRLAEARALLRQRSADGLGFVPRPDPSEKTTDPEMVKRTASGNAKVGRGS